MNLEKYLSVTPEIQQAVKEGKPVVALESTILSHGMPFPENVEFAHKVEEIVRGEGAIPATTAIIGGKLKVGLTPEELDLMCKGEKVGKFYITANKEEVGEGYLYAGEDVEAGWLPSYLYITNRTTTIVGTIMVLIMLLGVILQKLKKR